MSRWTTLSEPWQVAFTAATAAYLTDNSAPIGAVVVNGRGEVVASGRNGMSINRLAHAEVNALSTIPREVDRSECELYTTLEPCPMCTGAIRMSQLRGVHFAAFDPIAGFTEFLQANEFMRAFPCAVHVPTNSELERVIVSLVMEYRERERHHRWRERWEAYHPEGASLGARLSVSGAYAEWISASLSAEQLYEHVALGASAA